MTEKEYSLGRLGTLLEDVTGATTDWKEIRAVLAERVPTKVLVALLYRVEAALRQSFDEGVEAGKREAERP